MGDEQGGSDPTVWELCDRTAALLGKEAAMFMPSGTMCNQVAIATHCRPGDEILAHEDAHIQSSEAGGPGAISGVMIRGLPGERGIFSAETLRDAIRPVSRYSPPQRLVEVEQTANKGGGACWQVAELKAVADVAHEHGMKVHMDGARVLNAAVALGVAASDVVADCDTVWLDFTKGLGAPLGAVLAGPKDFIGEAWRWKQRLGGSMRQGGMNAAACIYALQHNIDRLAEDHANAAALARGMASNPGDHGGDAGNESGFLRYHRHRPDSRRIRRSPASVRSHGIRIGYVPRPGLHASGRQRGADRGSGGDHAAGCCIEVMARFVSCSGQRRA